MDKIIYVIGIGEDGAGGLTPQSLSRVQESEVLFGGERQLSFFSRYSGEKIVLQGGLETFADKLEGLYRERQTVVLASGDPLFYGIAGFLVRRFGPQHVQVVPHYTSVQLAFARLG
ncbi:precorrin-6y C5,15-methyltransferase (decarboxylating) subunit CbiE, partial [Paenibacillus ihuae]|uniref:precorrin-6y C5,15-methyltransferase (decarboxylating) subunit CbiE n=1 Tax=Paenibacillus ihuae TaxID=1232431 RepID=UPI003158B609